MCIMIFEDTLRIVTLKLISTIQAKICMELSTTPYFCPLPLISKATSLHFGGVPDTGSILLNHFARHHLIWACVNS